MSLSNSSSKYRFSDKTYYSQFWGGRPTRHPKVASTLQQLKKRFFCKYERDLLTCQLFLWVPHMWLADATSCPWGGFKIKVPQLCFLDGRPRWYFIKLTYADNIRLYIMMELYVQMLHNVVNECKACLKLFQIGQGKYLNRFKVILSRLSK